MIVVRTFLGCLFLPSRTFTFTRDHFFPCLTPLHSTPPHPTWQRTRIFPSGRYIFITAHYHFDSADTQRYSAEKLLRDKQRRAAQVLTREDRLSICRVHNAILVLRELRVPITPERIEAVVAAAGPAATQPKNMLKPAARAVVADHLRQAGVL